MSSYDAPEAMITPAEFRESMKLVKLQIAIPISVLMGLGTNLVCALALKPGLGVYISCQHLFLLQSITAQFRPRSFRGDR